MAMTAGPTIQGIDAFAFFFPCVQADQTITEDETKTKRLPCLPRLEYLPCFHIRDLAPVSPILSSNIQNRGTVHILVVGVGVVMCLGREVTFS